MTLKTNWSHDTQSSRFSRDLTQQCYFLFVFSSSPSSSAMAWQRCNCNIPSSLQRALVTQNNLTLQRLVSPRSGLTLATPVRRRLHVGCACTLSSSLPGGAGLHHKLLISHLTPLTWTVLLRCSMLICRALFCPSCGEPSAGLSCGLHPSTPSLCQHVNQW